MVKNELQIQYKFFKEINRILRSYFTYYYISDDNIIYGGSAVNMTERFAISHVDVPSFNNLLINPQRVFSTIKNINLTTAVIDILDSAVKIESINKSEKIIIDKMEKRKFFDRYNKSIKILQAEVPSYIKEMSFYDISDDIILDLINNRRVEVIADGSPLLFSKALCKNIGTSKNLAIKKLDKFCSPEKNILSIKEEFYLGTQKNPQLNHILTVYTIAATLS